MCGIYFGKDLLNGKSLSYRGITDDYLGFTERKENSFFYCYHSLLPLQTTKISGKQPVHLSSDILMMYVGEIFSVNGKQLECGDTSYLKELFQGKSLLEISEILKRDSLKWDGFWALVFIDHKKGEILLFTDPLGKKQLYENDRNEIASEINPLLDRKKKNKLDYSYLGEVLKNGYNINEKTPYLGIRKIKNGVIHYGKIHSFFKERHTCYIDFFKKQNKHREIDSMLESAIDMRLKNINNDKIACLLSGGLDSTILVSYLKEKSKKCVYFCIENSKDVEYVKKLEKDWGINVCYLKMPKIDEEIIKEVLKVHQIPVDLGSVIPNYLLFKEIKKKHPEIRIILTGDGADELFKGYKRNNDFNYQLHDILNEMVYYHLPRLDRLSSFFTFELRNPFLSNEMINYVLSKKIKENKKDLKKSFKNRVPKYILERKKEPLKNTEIRDGKKDYQRKIIDLFINTI